MDTLEDNKLQNDLNIISSKNINFNTIKNKK